MSSNNMRIEETDSSRPAPAEAASLGDSLLATRSLPVKAALTLLRTYKVYMSPWFAGSCRYIPTCSVYAYEAIERFGVMQGMWMGLKRLLRCQPLSRRFGYDPVPEKADLVAHQSAAVEPKATSPRELCKGAHS